MRPLSVTLDGFRSHATKSTFDFRDRRLVGIVGPIGSGKSSILDAVAFALYGMTPTERSNTKSLIHQRADSARVELVFEVDGQVWRVVRALRRVGQSEHALFRYSTDSAFLAGDTPVETVLKKGEVDQRVELLLGLDFAAFNRSVLLAQGRFAELLRATSTQRDEVFKGVFGFDRIGVMERLAKLRRDTATRELEALGREREELAENRRRLEQAETDAARARSRLEELVALGPTMRELGSELADAERLQASAEAKLADLGELAERLPAPAETEETLAAAEESLAVVTELADEVKISRSEAQAAAQAVGDLLAELGGEARLSEAAALVASIATLRAGLAKARERSGLLRGELQEQAKTRQAAQARLEEAGAGEEAAGTRLSDAEESAAQAEAALHLARHADMAATLRSDLVAGEPCPVCRQDVNRLPDKPTVDLSAVEHVLVLARDRLKEALADARIAGQQLTGAAKEVEAAEAAMTRLDQSVQEADDEVVVAETALADRELAAARLLGAGDPAENLHARQVQLTEARTLAEQRSRHADALQSRLDLTRQEAQKVGQALEQLSAKLHGIAGRLGEEITIGGNPAEVKGAVGELRSRWSRLHRDALESRAAAAERRTAAQAEIDRLLEGAGLSLDTEFGEAKAEAQAAWTGIVREVEFYQERIAASGELTKQVNEAQHRAELYRGLAAELTPSRFLNFLLKEERAVLSELGGHRFEELSGGRYRFSDDGDFDIVDLTAAEQVRKADSLSGGEMFLASLALALALAEMVTRGGGRLDAFFLDEGFGSLDPEHLDLAMTGIERLVTDHEDRLVVIVSHVPEMRSRLEQLIELDKDPGTGATVVVRSPDDR